MALFLPEEEREDVISQDIGQTHTLTSTQSDTLTQSLCMLQRFMSKTALQVHIRMTTKRWKLSQVYKCDTSWMQHPQSKITIQNHIQMQDEKVTMKTCCQKMWARKRCIYSEKQQEQTLNIQLRKCTVKTKTVADHCNISFYLFWLKCWDPLHVQS